MKHLILEDDKLSFMVFYRPQDTAKMYETIFRAQHYYWKSIDNGNKHDFSLIFYIKECLNERGFKVVDITKEIDDKINVYRDLEIDSFVYKKRKIHQLATGYGFFDKDWAYNTCETIEQAIDYLDKEGE
jgi:hypothetical protein